MKKSTTYFVSSLNGNDENDGLSESTAFKSLNKINEIELAPGDKVFPSVIWLKLKAAMTNL